MATVASFLETPKTIVGVIHLPALPGYADSPGLDAAIEKALAELGALATGGADAVLVENENDRPHRVESAPETTAVMTRIARELVLAAGDMPVGVEILLNDPRASLAVALASGARFIRTDYFVDRMLRPEHGGEMHIDPDGLMQYREQIGASSILVLADIQVKYARMISPRPLSESARLARSKGADAIVVTGTLTGDPPDVASLEETKRGSGDIPVLIGSGLAPENAGDLLTVADGAIVGTSLKSGDAVDSANVAALTEVVRRLRADA